MLVTTDRLADWLRQARRLNGLHLEAMTQSYDLDGALSAGQPELAWRARQRILVLSAELFLQERGLRFDVLPDLAEHMSAVLEALEAVHSDHAAEVWDMVLRPAPTDATELAADIQATIDYCRDVLGVTTVGSRAATIRAWADSVRLLREAAKDLGVAQSDQWYLRDETLAAEHLDWYDKVMAVVTAESQGSSRTESGAASDVQQ